MTMKVQVLFFEGCPNYKPAMDLVRSVAPNASIQEVEIRSNQDAERMRFLGSPTILVDGVDIEPSARTRTDFGFSCRTYNGKGVPSREIVTAAIAQSESSLSPFQQSGSLWLATGSIAAAAIASACCWLPLILLAFGMSAAGLSTTFETFQPWLFAGAVTLLAGGFCLAYRRQSCCTAKCNRTMVWIAAPIVLAFAVFSQFAGALVDAVDGRACCVSPEVDAPTAGQITPTQSGEVKIASTEPRPVTLTVLSNDGHELKDTFNLDRAAVKVILIVSPRCPMCRAGAQEVQEKALAQVDSDKLTVYVVWIPRFPFDSRAAAQQAMELVPDKRARHFWDASGHLGKEYGKIIKLPGKRDFAWDVYFVFDPKAEWVDTPPTPDFWMHQLGGTEPANRLDGEKFRDAIVRRLPVK
jgi:hypothetical protein